VPVDDDGFLTGFIGRRAGRFVGASYGVDVVRQGSSDVLDGNDDSERSDVLGVNGDSDGCRSGIIEVGGKGSGLGVSQRSVAGLADSNSPSFRVNDVEGVDDGGE